MRFIVILALNHTATVKFISPAKGSSNPTFCPTNSRLQVGNSVYSAFSYFARTRRNVGGLRDFPAVRQPLQWAGRGSPGIALKTLI